MTGIPSQNSNVTTGEKPLHLNIAQWIFPKRSYERMFKSWCKKSGRKYYEQEQDTDLSEYSMNPTIDSDLKNMLVVAQKVPEETRPSQYWQVLMKKNLKQIIDKGYDNFKQTVALNYFTFIQDKGNIQPKFLESNCTEEIRANAKEAARKNNKHDLFSRKQSSYYDYITLLLWDFTKKHIDANILEGIEEPRIGNPPAIQVEGRLLTQDLLYSAWEYSSVIEGVGSLGTINSVVELGAGYGRTAHVFLKLKPKIRYVIADIPPALYVSQKYLSRVFFDRKIFKFREFDHYDMVREEIEQSQVVFLMPHQLKLLPQKSVDLFLAIDCLHEMVPAQIQYYFNIINGLTKKFYFTCAKKTSLPYEDMQINENDYPVSPEWKKVFWQTRQVIGNYFEAFYNIGE